MTAKETLTALSKRGITLKHDGSKLYAEKGSLSPDDLAQINAHEPEIIALVAKQPKEKGAHAAIDES